MVHEAGRRVDSTGHLLLSLSNDKLISTAHSRTGPAHHCDGVCIAYELLYVTQQQRAYVGHIWVVQRGDGWREEVRLDETEQQK